MNKYNNLEMSILSCILLKPELMEQVIFEDKHIVSRQRLWQFMKAFYNRYKTFDIQLMYSICKDKWQIVQNIIQLLDYEPSPSLFDTYQKQLIDLYNEGQENKIKIDKVYKLANELYVRNITIEEFKKNIKEVLEWKEKKF